MGVWSRWVTLWPMLLATFAAGGAHLTWFVVACVRRQWRVWIPVALAGIIMCGFAFMTVAANFPDA